MEWITGAFAAAAALLAVAGVPKIVAPANTVNAVRSVGLPASRDAMRLLGVVELVVGVGAVLVGGTVAAALVAAHYAGFAGFIVLALRRGGAIASCGCFGGDDTPATWTHLGLNVAATAVALVAAAGPVPGLPAAMAGAPLAGIPLLAATAVCTWLAYVALTVLPTVSVAARPAATGPGRGERGTRSTA